MFCMGAAAGSEQVGRAAGHPPGAAKCVSGAVLGSGARFLTHELCSIVGKLRELGWGEELDKIAPLDYHPLREHAHVKVSKPLTNRGTPAPLFDV